MKLAQSLHKSWCLTCSFDVDITRTENIDLLQRQKKSEIGFYVNNLIFSSSYFFLLFIKGKYGHEKTMLTVLQLRLLECLLVTRYQYNKITRQPFF